MKLFNFEVSESLVVGLFSVLILSSLLLFYRPRVMFSENNQFKKFGTGNTQTNTLFPFWLVVSVFSIMIYFVYTMFYQK